MNSDILKHMMLERWIVIFSIVSFRCTCAKTI